MRQKLKYASCFAWSIMTIACMTDLHHGEAPTLPALLCPALNHLLDCPLSSKWRQNSLSVELLWCQWLVIFHFVCSDPLHIFSSSLHHFVLPSLHWSPNVSLLSYVAFLAINHFFFFLFCSTGARFLLWRWLSFVLLNLHLWTDTSDLLGFTHSANIANFISDDKPLSAWWAFTPPSPCASTTANVAAVRSWIIHDLIKLIHRLIRRAQRKLDF